MSPLSNDVRIAQGVIDLIKSAGIDEDDNDLTILVAAECDLPDRLIRMLRVARYAEADAQKLGKMIDEMKERKSRFDRKSESLRKTAAWALEECGLSKLSAPDFDARLTKGKPSLILPDDPNVLPDHLCRITRQPNKAAIREALDAGEHIDGVTLGNATPYLSIRGS